MRRFAGHLVAPVTALLIGLVWWLSERDNLLLDTVPTRDETFTTSPYAGLVFLGFVLALAISRIRPTWALTLAGLLLVAQLLFWPARLSQTSWTGYFVLIPMVAMISSRVAGRYRRRFLVGLLVAAAAVAALLTVPSLSMNGEGGTINGKPWSIQPAVTQSMIVWLVVCGGVAYASWAIGRRWLAEAAARPGMPETATPPASDQVLSALSTREQEVFMSVARGWSNADVAKHLFITEATVKTHVGSALAKLGLTSRSELIAYAYDHGIMRPTYGQESDETGTRITSQ
ncbi:response regulator transcription factor [Rathayibacter festucae]|uniref:response regulator transcription factor n=1 Tax=Rathayibacter festucae TaxID=110937 RepID=UPI002A6A1BFA|nr:response regulator transcription factor [Rathayibacter festucae]MDY0912297.1 response regulator transcription factor [Rathayibacter festucae]